MRVPDSLFVRFQPSFSVAGVFLLSVYPLRTGCTVFRPVGAWDENRAAYYAPLHVAAVKDLRFQSLVQRQNCPAEPFAANGIRNRLRAGVGFPIVQQQAVAAVKVAALPTDQAVRPLPLCRGHAVRCSIRFSLQHRQIFMWVIFHVVPPLFVRLPFSPKELPHSWRRRGALPGLRANLARSRLMATLLSFGRSCSCQGALHRWTAFSLHVLDRRCRISERSEIRQRKKIFPRFRNCVRMEKTRTKNQN